MVNDLSLKCEICPHNCQLYDGDLGVCGVIKADNNSLFFEGYGRIHEINIETIENQHMFHFSPGAKILVFGGVNQGTTLGYYDNTIDIRSCKYFSAGAIAHMAIARKAFGVVVSYRDPCVYCDFLGDLSEKCHNKNLFLGIKTNAFISSKMWDKIINMVDFLNIDMTLYQCGNSDFIEERVEKALEINKHVEFSFVLKTKNPNKYIFHNKNIPIHIIDDSMSGFNIKNALLRDGFNYVYHHGKNISMDNTTCHHCGKTVVNRENNISIDTNNDCQICRDNIILWE